MFKLIKSKKGFTLVELMIVVVIMAILVAVAVPIFSAVTKNARTKTCHSNQREIQVQLNNAEMSDIIDLQIGDVYTLTTNEDGDGAEWSASNGASLTSDDLNNLFSKPPYCPYENNTIKVSIESAQITNDHKAYKIVTVCDKNGSDEVHGS